MEFGDRPEDEIFRTEVRAWLEANAPAKLASDRPPPAFSSHGGKEDVAAAKAMQAKLADARLAGITWPAQYGGRGGTVSQQIIFDEEAARFEVPTEVFVLGIGLAGPTMVAHGTPSQKERYLAPLLRGEEIWCQLFSEPGAGSDLAGMRTRARCDGDEWVINGQKSWSSGAHFADLGIMPVRTDPSKPKHRGITYFLVDMRTPGITVRPLKQITGDAHFNEVFFDDVRVPKENMLGELNGGWAVTQTTLMNERMMIGGAGLGIDPRHLAALARATRMNGHFARDDPVVRQELAEIYARSEVLRFMRYRLITALAQGQVPGPEGSIMKLATGQLLRRATDLALRIQAHNGLLTGEAAPTGGVWQALFLAAPSIRIAGGTDEIQRNIIAERVLGLPREPPS